MHFQVMYFCSQFGLATLLKRGLFLKERQQNISDEQNKICSQKAQPF